MKVHKKAPSFWVSNIKFVFFVSLNTNIISASGGTASATLETLFIPITPICGICTDAFDTELLDGGTLMGGWSTAGFTRNLDAKLLRFTDIIFLASIEEEFVGAWLE